MATDIQTTTPRPAPAAPSDQRLTGRAKLVLFVLCAAQFMVALDFSVLNVALPVLGKDLGLSTSALQWAVTAFALPSGGFLLLFGRIADLYGRKKLFLTGLAVFAAASLLATLAWDPASFLAGRALQGLGAAVIVPTGMSLLTTTFPEGPLRDRALGISGTLLSLGFTIGMVLGGVMTDTLGWRSTMALLSVAAVIVLLLAPGLLPESRTPERPRLDVPGAVTVTGGLLAVIYALSTAAQRGFGGVDVWGTLALGLALLAAFVVVESRSPAPLVSLPMLKRRTVAWGNIGGLVTFSMMSTVIFVLTLYLQEILRLSAFQTGLVFGVQGLASAVMRLLRPEGHRPLRRPPDPGRIADRPGRVRRRAARHRNRFRRPARDRRRVGGQHVPPRRDRLVRADGHQRCARRGAGAGDRTGHHHPAGGPHHRYPAARCPGHHPGLAVRRGADGSGRRLRPRDRRGDPGGDRARPREGLRRG